MANTERVKQAIAIMKRAHNLDMRSFQRGSPTIISTETELHECGNTACFAGYVAISPEFKKAGGGMSPLGSPIFQGRIRDDAISQWLECSRGFARALVYGGTYFYPVPFEEVNPYHVIEKLNLLLTGEAE